MISGRHDLARRYMIENSIEEDWANNKVSYNLCVTVQVYNDFKSAIRMNFETVITRDYTR